MSTLATATATDAAAIYRDMCLRSGAGFPDVLVVDHDAKFASDVFRTFAKGMGSCLIVGLGLPQEHQRDTLRAYEATPTVARTTEAATSRSPSSPSKTRPRSAMPA